MDFEEQLGNALRDAGGHYDLTPDRLLDRGLSRGRTLRRRRRAYRIGGAALALALVGTGTAFSVGALSGGSHQAADTTKGAGFSGQQILSLLTGMLPPGTVTQEQANGAGGGRPYLSPPSARFVYDDGRGGAQFQFGSAPVNDKDVLASGASCPTKKEPTVVSCKQTTLHDGSTVAFAETDFNQRTGLAAALQWTATIVTPKGDRIWLDEYNSPTGSFTHGTRLAPPLDGAQLSALVTSPSWKPLFAALYAAKPDHQPTQAQVIATARQLLPAGVTFVRNDAENQEGSADIDITGGGSAPSKGSGVRTAAQDDIDITVQRWPGEARSEIAGEGYGKAVKLADGTLLLTDSDLNDSTGKKVTEFTAWTANWRVYALRPDGTSVQLMETLNTFGKNKPGKPVMSVAQLKAMALSPGWLG
jgi:hypothetical protein